MASHGASDVPKLGPPAGAVRRSASDETVCTPSGRRSLDVFDHLTKSDLVDRE
jgi:hypothetical protein